MRVVIQRVKEAHVQVNKEITGEIKQGLLVFVGIENPDTQEDITWICKKICQMRIFDDPTGIMNKSLLDIQGEILLISQFTLHASTKKGNRPSYMKASRPEQAKPIYHALIHALSSYLHKPIQTGRFGAMMSVHLINDGPVTILLDSKNKE